MKVHCKVIEEQKEKATGPNYPFLVVWKCQDCAYGATSKSVFLYQLTRAEETQFGGNAVGKFVELSIVDWKDITRRKRRLIRMKGTVSKFDCEPPVEIADPEHEEALL